MDKNYNKFENGKQQGRFGGETVPGCVESTSVLCIYFIHFQ